MGKLATYDPAKVSLIIGGHIVKGYADGTFITAARNSDTWTRSGGADGEQTRAKSNDKSGIFTCVLMQSSDSNAVLQGISLADESSNAGLVPIMLKDNNGSEIASGELCWNQKPSDKGFGKESGDREWVFETGELIYAGGGIAASTKSE